MPPSP
ncbi:Photosystem I reaction center subunit N, chloroplastic, partial [Auxenochlorella protothecoides]